MSIGRNYTIRLNSLRTRRIYFRKNVQIKSTDRWAGSACSCMLYAFHQRAYTANQIDYFAIYIVPDDIWYIFPVSRLLGQSVVVLTPHRKGHKHERYKEAWDLLRNRAGRQPELSCFIKPPAPKRKRPGHSR